MKLLERISIDPAVRFGKPCVRGTRITVGDVLGYLAGGTTEEQLLAEFPQLSREDVRACLAYAAERERRTVGVPLGNCGTQDIADLLRRHHESVRRFAEQNEAGFLILG